MSPDCTEPFVRRDDTMDPGHVSFFVLQMNHRITRQLGKHTNNFETAISDLNGTCNAQGKAAGAARKAQKRILQREESVGNPSCDGPRAERTNCTSKSR